jgi:hypothetical protein
MTTMMQHPKHGKHPATGHEIEHMKTLGWTVCPPKVKTAPEAPQGAQSVGATVSTSDAVIVPPAASMNRDDMKAKAASLGITFKHNISNVALADLIAQKAK